MVLSIVQAGFLKHAYLPTAHVDKLTWRCFFKARWHKDQAVSAHETRPKPAVRPASRRGLGMGHVMIFTGKDGHTYIYIDVYIDVCMYVYIYMNGHLRKSRQLQLYKLIFQN